MSSKSIYNSHDKFTSALDLRSYSEIGIEPPSLDIPKDSKKWGGSWHPDVNKGRILTEEHKQKIGEGRKGQTHSEESKEKISKSMKGTKSNKGYKWTPEQKAKLAASRRGKKFPRNKT